MECILSAPGLIFVNIVYAGKRNALRCLSHIFQLDDIDCNAQHTFPLLFLGALRGGKKITEVLQVCPGSRRGRAETTKGRDNEGQRQRANAMDDTKRREKSEDEGSEQDDQGPMQDKREPADPCNAMSSPEHSVCSAIIADEDGAEKSDASDWTNVSFDSRFVPINKISCCKISCSCLLACSRL